MGGMNYSTSVTSKITSIDTFVSKLRTEPDYSARKVVQLLDAYRKQIVAEATVDAVLEDINCNAVSCI
jgi:hypothetical protein